MSPRLDEAEDPEADQRGRRPQVKRTGIGQRAQADPERGKHAGAAQILRENLARGLPGLTEAVENRDRRSRRCERRLLPQAGGVEGLLPVAEDLPAHCLAVAQREDMDGV
jgi:hypothetical protein